VKAIFKGPEVHWACVYQAALLAYFIRVDPIYGAEMTRKALSMRTGTGCYHTVLTDVSAMEATPELESIAIHALEDPDPEVAADAAWMLGRHGSANAEPAIRKRLQEWHMEWQGKADRLEYRQTQTSGDRAQGALESSLWDALAQGVGWLAGPEKLKQIADLCVSKNARSQVDTLAHLWRGAVTIQCIPGYPDKPDWVVMQYTLHSMQDLKTKLGQFPKGTTFQFGAPWNDTEQMAALSEVKQFLSTHSYIYTRTLLQ